MFFHCFTDDILIENSAARLLTRTRKREHITPVQASLHWLPVKYTMDFKELIFVYQSIHKYAPYIPF